MAAGLNQLGKCVLIYLYTAFVGGCKLQKQH